MIWLIGASVPQLRVSDVKRPRSYRYRYGRFCSSSDPISLLKPARRPLVEPLNNILDRTALQLNK